MTEAEMQMPQPTEEHKRLEENAGVWKVDCTFYMDPSQPPMKVEAKETVEMFGGFFTVSLFESEMFGMPFKGRATLGYEPATSQYVSTWVDTMTPQLFHFTGNVDDTGTLVMTGRGLDCHSGSMADYRTTEKTNADGTRTFEMFMTPPGADEIKLFTHVYSRA